jgi:4-amino-4-deoxy-L-arabinose transferase-like glycosyltransferase
MKPAMSQSAENGSLKGEAGIRAAFQGAADNPVRAAAGNQAHHGGARGRALRGGPSDGALLLGFLAFNAIFRLALIRQNAGEYTDGILQITQFERADSFWPPLYTALVWVVRMMGVEAILAGRLVAVASSVLLVLPLWSLARSWSGRRAALFTVALYTVSPLALRWSLHVMTDVPFLLFFHLACAALLGSAARLKAEKENKTSQADPAYGAAASAGNRLAWATLWAVLATLTRYQGLMLVPLVGWVLVLVWRRRGAGRAAATAIQLAWLALPAWLLYQRFGHIGQVAERQAGDWAKTLLNYWNLFEMFLYILPYAVTLPVFAFFVIGLVRGSVDGVDKVDAVDGVDGPVKPETGPTYEGGEGQTREGQTWKGPTREGQTWKGPTREGPTWKGPTREGQTWKGPTREGPTWEGQSLARPPVRWLLLYVALAVLAAQSVFQSFLTRYLLPLLPLLLTCAGAGMARMERFLASEANPSRRRAGRWLSPLTVGVTMVWPLGFGLASVFLQRGAFEDLYAAGRMIRDRMPPSAKVYSNESYKPNMNGIKLAFASGRRVEMIPDIPALESAMRQGQSQREILEKWGSGMADAAGVPRMEPGSVVALHSAYGGPAGMAFLEALLSRRYKLKPVPGGYFESRIVPLFPDIMQEPGTHQNPLAWGLRYQPQEFQTRLYVVP